MKPKDTDENLESVSYSACEGTGKKEKRQMNPDVHSSLGTITMAQNNKIGLEHTVTCSLHASAAAHNKEWGRVFHQEERGRAGEALGLHGAVFLITDTRTLLTAHRATATNSSICHCHFPSARHCSGNYMCKAELPASSFDEGTAVQGCLKPKQAYVSYYVPQQES